MYLLLFLLILSVIFIIEWLGIGDFVHDIGYNIGKWIKRQF